MYRRLIFAEESVKVIFLIMPLFLIVLLVGNLYFAESMDGNVGIRMVFSIAIQFVIPFLLLPLVIKVSYKFPIFNGWKYLFFHLFTCSIYIVFFIVVAHFLYDLLNSRFVLVFSFNTIAKDLNRQFLISGSLAFMTYWSIVVLSGVQIYYRRLNITVKRANELKQQLSKSTLSALRAQLRPHFLFNTLNMVDYQIRTEPDKAIETVERLQDLLKSTFEQNIADSRTIREEVDFLNKYLEIQKSRFKTRLVIELNLASDTMELVIPSYLIQPLVENSIKHGVARSMETLKINIVTSFDADNFKIEILDNGIFENSAKKEIKWGVGLRNIDERLKLFFGEEAGLEIGFQEKKGFRSALIIPKKYL